MLHNKQTETDILSDYQRARVISDRVGELEEGKSRPLVDARKLGLVDTYSVAVYEFENGLLKFEIINDEPIKSRI